MERWLRSVCGPRDPSDGCSDLDPGGEDEECNEAAGAGRSPPSRDRTDAALTGRADDPGGQTPLKYKYTVASSVIGGALHPHVLCRGSIVPCYQPLQAGETLTVQWDE